jgi:monoamine oxidase
MSIGGVTRRLALGTVALSAALAAELGVGLYQQFEDGETSYEFAGEVLREQAFRARYAGELSGVERVLRTLDRMAETVPVSAPWLAHLKPAPGV